MDIKQFERADQADQAIRELRALGYTVALRSTEVGFYLAVGCGEGVWEPFAHRVEELSQKVQAMMVDVDQRLEYLGNRADLQTGRADRLQEMIDGLRHDVANLDGTSSRSVVRIRTIEENIRDLAGRVESLEARAHSTTLVFSSVYSRLAGLEAKDD